MYINLTSPGETCQAGMVGWWLEGMKKAPRIVPRGLEGERARLGADSEQPPQAGIGGRCGSMGLKPVSGLGLAGAKLTGTEGPFRDWLGEMFGSAVIPVERSVFPMPVSWPHWQQGATLLDCVGQCSASRQCLGKLPEGVALFIGVIEPAVMVIQDVGLGLPAGDDSGCLGVRRQDGRIIGDNLLAAERQL